MVETFYTTIGQYPTLYDFLAITQDELILCQYHLDNPNMCAKCKTKYFQPTLLSTPLYSGEMLHHMCDSGESPDVSVCRTISTMTSPSVCQSHDLSVFQSEHESTWNSIHPSVCLLSIPSIQPSAHFMVKTTMSIAG